MHLISSKRLISYFLFLLRFVYFSKFLLIMGKNVNRPSL
ncbi:putative membrane protein [Helicobacter pylori R018c]|uniref:Putative membrane protein n=1 Tax=Helicobacter pylori R018c TaxID=1145110 RepID=K2KRH2_HELPX|nr:putative membrane protein [Helicobacter pylori R018c]